MTKPPRRINQTIQRAIDAAGGQTALARGIGVSQGLVWQWLTSALVVPAERCVAIENFTKGAVLRSHLRPDLFVVGPSQKAAAN